MRDKLLSILSGLDSESLVKALAANGIKVDMAHHGGDDMVMDGLAHGSNQVEKWGDRKIKVKAEDARPSLVDKDYLEHMEPEKPEREPDMSFLNEDEDASLDPYMHPAG